MIFETFLIKPASSKYEDGKPQYIHNPICIEGKGKWVKIYTTAESGVLVGDERLASEYNPYIIDATHPKAVLPLTELPNELYLAEGERLYVTHIYSTNGTPVSVTHYNKSNERAKSSFNIELTGTATETTG
jgi:hypothetical protein